MSSEDADPTAKDIAEFLERRIRSLEDCRIAYSDLTDQFGMPRMDHRSTGHPLDAILGELDDQDHALGRPARSAIVVRKEDGVLGIPGKGFFTYVCGLRGIKPPNSKDGRVIFHAEEFRDLQAHYRT